MRRVVVTGMGAITPIGNNVETFWNNVKAGVLGIDEITKFDTTEYSAKLAAEVKDFNAKEVLGFKQAKRLSPFSQYAVATNSIAKKGVQRVEDPLAGSRGSAPAFPHKHAHTVCSSDQLNREKGSPEGRRPFGRVKGQRPLRLSIVLAFFARIKGKRGKRC